MRAKLKRFALELAVVLLGLLALRAYQTRTHARGAAPVLSAPSVDGQTVSLGALGPGPVVIHFWATWCGVCRAEESSIAALAKTGRLITVASRSGSAVEVAAYMRARGLSFPVVHDGNGSLAASFGVRAFPTTFFVDGKGGIATSEVGYTTYLGLRARLWFAGL